MAGCAIGGIWLGLSLLRDKEKFVPNANIVCESIAISGGFYPDPNDPRNKWDNVNPKNLGKTYGSLGIVISFIETPLTDTTYHALEKIAARGVTQEVISETLNNPIVTLAQDCGKKFLKIGPRGAVVVENSGKLITAYNYYDEVIQLVIREAIHGIKS